MSLTSIIVSRIVESIADIDRSDVEYMLDILLMQKYVFTEQQVIVFRSSNFDVDMTSFPHVSMVEEMGTVHLNDIIRMNTERKLGHISPDVIEFFLETKASRIVDALDISRFIDDALERDTIDVRDMTIILANMKARGFFYTKGVLDTRLMQHIALIMQSNRCCDIRRDVLNRLTNGFIPTSTSNTFLNEMLNA
jgi:hypothetical protein